MPNIVCSVEQRQWILKQSYRGIRIPEIQNNFMDQFETLAYPDESTIRRIVAKFESNGSVNPAHTVIKYPTRKIPDNVQQYICANMEFNSRNQPKRLAHELGISDRSVRKILKSNGYKRYKPQFHQQLINNDNQRRLQFCTRMRNGPGIIPPIDDICFSDEATVHGSRFTKSDPKNLIA